MSRTLTPNFDHYCETQKLMYRYRSMCLSPDSVHSTSLVFCRLHLKPLHSHITYPASYLCNIIAFKYSVKHGQYTTHMQTAGGNNWQLESPQLHNLNFKEKKSFGLDWRHNILLGVNVQHLVSIYKWNVHCSLNLFKDSPNFTQNVTGQRPFPSP